MTIKYYKSATDDGGAIGAEIFSGVANALFPANSAIDLTFGVETYRKIWIETDETKSILNYLANDGLYDVAIFDSANPLTDVFSDLTGVERKHSQATITATTATTVTVEYDSDMQSYVAGDALMFDSIDKIIQAFVDNLDGTGTITLTTVLDNHASYVGTTVSTAIQRSMVAQTPQAFWLKLKIEESTVHTQDVNVFDISVNY